MMANKIIDGKVVCMATHPKMPNHSGHARGRAKHLVKEGQLTVCNMKVDTLVKDYEIISKFCKICFKEFLASRNQSN